jgi:crotonobetainyl-CoA:carnitine CoA-transferase CaiB-like acyl-CoA transferase
VLLEFRRHLFPRQRDNQQRDRGVSMTPTFRPLDGITVVDISHVIAGPFATFHLAQLGADVLKIENVNGGDVMRRGARGAKAFAALNAGKRKMRMDISSATDRDRIIELTRTADVFVDNLRPGVLEARGLGWSAMKAVNPRLIYCSISGFGRDGEGTGRPAYDHVVQAATGMTLICGEEGDPPVKISFPLIDAASGMIAAMAVLAALRERDRVGHGMLIDVSMAGAALQLMYPLTCDALTEGLVPKRAGNQAPSGSPAADVFATADGGHLAIAGNTPRQFLALLDVLGIAALARDPALFDTPPDADAPAGFLNSKNPAAIKSALRARIAEFDAGDLEARLIAAKVPAARVRALPEFAREADRSGAIAAVDLEDEGTRVRSPGLGFRVRK